MSTTEREAGVHAHTTTITVNEHAVSLAGPKATGGQIKQAAISQGVQMDIGFVLSQELPNRRTRIVGDEEEVTINKNSRFVAIAPDDNS